MVIKGIIAKPLLDSQLDEPVVAIEEDGYVFLELENGLLLGRGKTIEKAVADANGRCNGTGYGVIVKEGEYDGK